eukprot:TRINITY_DN22976_c0_g1_i2.p1 TRINITY_DN22976_c0_g1~~TRINITY_DN22976_c0_g1_i2.p1  ORF type:complete len:368 (+),score=26.08 TRINITY_DN22976_c0_g1_i2:51-1106(+)
MPCPEALPLSPTSRPGTEIPGYAGYVPRKHSGNVYGATFRKANEHATVNRGFDFAEVQSPSQRTRSPLSEAEAGRDQSEDRFIPGYGGYTPKVEAEGIFGLTFMKAAAATGFDSTSKRQDRKLVRSRSPDNFISGYTGYIPRVKAGGIYGVNRRTACELASDQTTDKPVNSRAADSPSGGSTRTSPRSFGSSRQGSREPTPRRSLSARRARSGSCGREIPGYGGYVPHKLPGNVYGVRFRAANDLAAFSRGEEHSPSKWCSPNREAWPMTPIDLQKPKQRNVYERRTMKERALPRSQSEEPAQTILPRAVNEVWIESLRGPISRTPSPAPRSRLASPERHRKQAAPIRPRA